MSISIDITKKFIWKGVVEDLGCTMTLHAIDSGGDYITMVAHFEHERSAPYQLLELDLEVYREDLAAPTANSELMEAIKIEYFGYIAERRDFNYERVH